MKNMFLPQYPHMFPEPIQGIADRAIAQGRLWRVKFQGSYWFARLYQPNEQVVIRPGEPVKVIAMEGITLLVTPTS